MPGAYMSLGYLKQWNDPAFHYFEWHYLKNIEDLLANKWHLLQGGFTQKCADLWYQICRLLELDQKVTRELWILLHGGAVGRALANECLWSLLSVEALEANYLNLSNSLDCSDIFQTRPDHGRNRTGFVSFPGSGAMWIRSGAALTLTFKSLKS